MSPGACGPTAHAHLDRPTSTFPQHGVGWWWGSVGGSWSGHGYPACRARQRWGQPDCAIRRRKCPSAVAGREMSHFQRRVGSRRGDAAGEWTPSVANPATARPRSLSGVFHDPLETARSLRSGGESTRSPSATAYQGPSCGSGTSVTPIRSLKSDSAAVPERALDLGRAPARWRAGHSRTSGCCLRTERAAPHDAQQTARADGHPENHGRRMRSSRRAGSFISLRMRTTRGYARTFSNAGSNPR